MDKWIGEFFQQFNHPAIQQHGGAAARRRGISCFEAVLPAIYAPVQDLLEKIKAAADARLTLPTGSTAAERLACYKGFLKVQTHRLKLLHRAGASGREVCAGRAAMLDALLQHLWATAKGSLSAEAQREFPPLALVAIGGYGRAELNPHSDIDFMFLHDGQIAANKPLPLSVPAD